MRRDTDTGMPWGMRGPDRSCAVAAIVSRVSELLISAAMLMYKQLAFTALMHVRHHEMACHNECALVEE